MNQLRNCFDHLAATTPLCAGVADVVVAHDRDAALAAVKKFPELLTLAAEAACRYFAALMVMMCPGQLTELVKRSGASIQAIREARA